jgi:chromosomal replication initiation ATPase DnaA
MICLSKRNAFVVTGLTLVSEKRIKPIALRDEIVKWLCSHYDVIESEFYSPCKKRPIAECRAITRFILRREYPYLSLQEIGKITNKSDHTTVMYSLQTIRDRIDICDKEVCDAINELSSHLIKWKLTAGE